MFKHRTAIEVMVIIFTLAIGFSILVLVLTIMVVKIKDPDASVGGAVNFLTSTIAAILAALLGLVAGKTSQLNKVPEEEQ